MLNAQRLPGSGRAGRVPGNLKVVFGTLLLLLISGCATDKFGDNAHNETTAPVSLPVGPVALVIGASANETVRALDAYNRYYQSAATASLYTQSIRQAYLETSDPELSVATVTRILEARFGDVHRFQSIEEASRSGVALVVKLDMQTRLINNRSSEPASHLSLEFYTAGQQYRGTVRSSSRRVLTPLWAGNKREKEIVSEIRQQGEVQAQALELLRENLATVPVGT